jgi:hypothetical protein
MAGRNGISLGGLLIIIGLIVALVENLWLGILLVVIGAFATGGFARGTWR